MIRTLAACLCITLSCAFAQTRVNLGPSQATSPNFASMPHTKSVQMGTTLPASCENGDLFLNTTAPALYACTAVSGSPAWNVLGGGLSYAGSYSSSATYALYNIVSYAGSSYVSLQPSNSGHPPDSSPAWWAVLAAQGPAGLVGAAAPLAYDSGAHSVSCPTCEVTGHKGQANGYAALDAAGKVPAAQLPPSSAVSQGAAHRLQTADGAGGFLDSGASFQGGKLDTGSSSFAASGGYSAPPALPGPGNMTCWFDSDRKLFRCKDDAGVVSGAVAGIADPADANCVRYIDLNGAQQRGACAAASAAAPLVFDSGAGSFSCPTCELTGHKGQANGYAALDSAGKVPAAQLPASTPGAVSQGAAHRLQTADGAGAFLDSGASLQGGKLNTGSTSFAASGGYSAPPPLPGPGNMTCWFDSDRKLLQCKDDAGVVSGNVAGMADPADANCVRYIDLNGAQQRGACGGGSSVPRSQWLPVAAGLQNGLAVPNSGVSILANGSLTPALVDFPGAAATYQLGLLQFPPQATAAGVAFADLLYLLPPAWSGSISIAYEAWIVGANGGGVHTFLQTGCISPGGYADNTLTAHPPQTVTVPAGHYGYRSPAAVYSNIDPGCSPGDFLKIHFGRDNTQPDDTLPDPWGLAGILLTIVY